MKGLMLLVKLLIAVNLSMAAFFAFLRLWSSVFFHLGMVCLLLVNLLISKWYFEGADNEEKDG